MPRTYIDAPHPTQAEIDAAIARAHKLRAQEFGRGIGALVRAIKSLFSTDHAPVGASPAR